ncbi:MAG: hypothetical protein IKS85_02385, partial [Lachnospiraceae bacterium]|nr:hypothetical protein [Lachnospiraceae bacterium]
SRQCDEPKVCRIGHGERAMWIALGESLLANQCKAHWMNTAKAVNATNRRFGGLGMAEHKDE